MNNSELAMIAAVGPDLELGSKGDLIWHIPDDLKNFKRLTTGHPVIMGRKTWESLPKRPLPGRLNIVLTRNPELAQGAIAVSSPEEALEICGETEFPFVIGGQQIYRLFEPYATMLFITEVDATTEKEVDAWFPEYRDNWQLEEASGWKADSKGIKYQFQKWTRE